MNEITLKRLRLLPVIATLIFAAGLVWFLRSPEPTVIDFMTGSKDGLYHRLALQIKSAVESDHEDIIINLITSAGSRENIVHLDEGKAQLALDVCDDSFRLHLVRTIVRFLHTL